MLLVDDQTLPANKEGDSSSNFASQTLSRLDKEAPPPYSQPAASSSRPLFLGARSPSARSNHFEIVERHGNIKGIWEIDSNLVIPASILEKQHWKMEDGPRPNIYLVSKQGNINGHILLSGPREHTFLAKAETHHGNVVIKLSNGHSQTVHLHCSSKQGNVTVYLPSTFHGHIDASTQHGKVVFSELLSTRLTRFSHQDGKHLAFLSPNPIPSGPDGAEAFQQGPDQLIASTKHGNVKIHYLEEWEQPTDNQPNRLKAKKGFFERLFS